MEKNETVTISLPKELADKLIENRRKNTDFKSISEYISYVLEQVLSNIEEKNVKERLKRLESLGYLD